MKILSAVILAAMMAIVLPGTALGADPCALCERNLRAGVNGCSLIQGQSARDHCMSKVGEYKKCIKKAGCKGKKTRGGGENKLFRPLGFN